MANKKINQLVLKTTIQSTDLFPLGDPTTGQLFKKTVAELQAAIGGAVISVNGLVGTVVLDTDDIQELATPTNRYFTEARARAAISLTTTGNSGASTYSSSTGVLNVPTYTLAGLGGITASFLSGGTGITYNSGTGVISYSGTVFTDASIRALFSAGTGISYNSSTGAITNSAPDQVVSIAGGTGITVTGTYPSFTVAYSGTVYTDSSVRALLSGTAPITYNSTTGAIGITQATTSTNGYLSSTDWNTFNGKQSALTLGNFTESTSSVLTITGGTGAIIGSGLTVQVKLASGSQSGYLSSTDWTTFNSKQNALTNPVTGTGTSGYVAYWNSSSSITGEAALYYDATNDRLGIGTATPSEKLSIIGGDVSISTTKRIYLDAGSGYLYLTSTANNGAMQFYTGDAERMRITATGNVGIGINPQGIGSTRTLEIGSRGAFYDNNDNFAMVNNGWYDTAWKYKQTGYATLLTTNGGEYIFSNASSGTQNGSITWSERMRITSGGYVSINSAVTSNGLVSIKQIGTARYGGINLYDESNNTFLGLGNTGSICIIEANYNTGSYTPLAFYTGGSERGRITTGGNWLLGTTTDNGERLYVSGSIRATGSITANSDARLKKNIERIENALEKVGQISGYTYNTIYDEDRHAGVIAQEIDKVLPEIVNKGNDGLMGVEYGNISALLIEAIKEQKLLIESLQAKVEALSK